MGTNYYWLETPPCEKCGSEGERRHVGKSSAGWVFALHVYPEEGILGLTDWIDLWQKHPNGVIRDEYGARYPVTDMLKVILVRFAKDEMGDTWYRANQAVRGPLRLARAQLGANCIGHGEGTYDHHVGDFS